MSLSLHEAARLSGRVIYLELLVLVLSLFSLGALATELLVPLDAATLELLGRIDDCVCGVFLVDFFVHAWRAPSLGAFLRMGWIDLLSSIPHVTWLRWGRVFRVFRILRALRSFQAVYAHFRRVLDLGAEQGFESAAEALGFFGDHSVVFLQLSFESVKVFSHACPSAQSPRPDSALMWPRSP